MRLRVLSQQKVTVCDLSADNLRLFDASPGVYGQHDAPSESDGERCYLYDVWTIKNFGNAPPLIFQFMIAFASSVSV